jgi:hybrid cluster-associated redox disulfide protein
MTIADIVQQYPQSVPVFLRHGLFCFGCGVARFENLEQGASVHGIDPDVLIDDINLAIANTAQESKESTGAQAANAG